jgi:hypothetical protein
MAGKLLIDRLSAWKLRKLLNVFGFIAILISKKIFGTSELFKKMWSQFPLFSANFDFGAQLSHENFKTSNPNFSHVAYN